MKKWSIFLTIFFFSIFFCTLKYVNMIRISNISFFRFCWKNEKLDWPKCARTLFNCQRKNKNIIYANVYRNTINDGDSQTSPLPISPEGGGTSIHRLLFGCSFFDGGSTVNRLLFLFFNLIMAYIYAVNTEQLWSTHDKVPHSCDGPKWKRQFLK